MRAFKSLFPEHFILKRNNLITNSDVSAWADLFSVEEGGGIQIDYLGYGNALSVCAEVEKKVSKPELVNRKQQRFNKQ
jgi:hypothetical protein